MKKIGKKLRTAHKIWQTQGLVGVTGRTKFFLDKARQRFLYQKWIKQYSKTTDYERCAADEIIKNFKRKPLISIVLPVYNVEEKWLRLCLDSVIRQQYGNWELCIADDNSPSPHIRRVLEAYTAQDKRIKVFFRKENGHISAASNSALEMATGEFTVLLDHDDELSEDALFFVALELNRFPQTAMIYSDEDMIDENGKRYAPKFKPDWSQDLFYSLNLITHLSAYRTEVLRQIGGFRIGAEGSQDYDLALRVTEKISVEQIRHIPRILYHWRAIRGSVALSADEKPYAHERAREAIRAHFERTEKSANVTPTAYNLHRVRYRLSEPAPKISLLTSDSDSDFIQKNDYENFEVFRVENGKNLAAEYNRVAKKTSGEVLIFLDGKYFPTESDWIREISGFALQKEIGAVGAKILFADETVRNGGIILGIENFFAFAHTDFPKDEGGSFGRLQLSNNFSAVSGVLAIRRELFDEINGFDAENFPNGFFDVDLCLRLGKENYRTVFTPYAEFVQTGDSATEKKLREKFSPEAENFRRIWKDQIAADKFYNPNFSLKNAKFQLAFPPRTEKISSIIL